MKIHKDKTRIKLNKYLASIGIGSRRYCDKLIENQLIKVNGVTATIGMEVDPDIDKIELQKLKKEYSLVPDMHYIALYKPTGYLTTIADPLNRPTILDLLPDVGDRIYPVGRLDFQSEGLILITNDGDLAFKLTHPKFMVSKTYLVKLKGKPERPLLKKLLHGINLTDGFTSLDSIRFIKTESKKNPWFEIKIHEGKNRIIRRIFEKIGHPVIKLIRVNFAGIELDRLKPGQWRYLTKKEIEMLKKSGNSIQNSKFDANS